MQALVLESHEGPGSLKLREISAPIPVRDEVRVRVRAVGINRADLLQCLGRYPGPPQEHEVPGLEFAGEVDGLGPGVAPALLGKRVCGIVAGGAYAGELVTHRELLLEIPAELDFEQAAAIPEAFLTAYDALHHRGQLHRGELVLIHAAASGVGTAALQLARLAGARSIATLRSADKVDRLRAFLDGEPLLVGDRRFADQVRQRSDGRGADLILDFVGAAYLEENLRALAPRGRLVVIGLLGGATATLDLGRLLTQRLRVEGTVLRTRPLQEKIALTREFAALMPHFAGGRLTPVVDRVLPFEKARAALEAMAANRNVGKLILRWD
jgi:putative PIG3 family NAD(P)H quinone oxidoreductase